MEKTITPAYLKPDYPIRKIPVNDGYAPEKLYELSCPNPECHLLIRMHGDRILEMIERLSRTGCPCCKLQFGLQEYRLKIGEEPRSLPTNNGKYVSFTVQQIEFTK